MISTDWKRKDKLWKTDWKRAGAVNEIHLHLYHFLRHNYRNHPSPSSFAQLSSLTTNNITFPFFLATPTPPSLISDKSLDSLSSSFFFFLAYPFDKKKNFSHLCCPNILFGIPKPPFKHPQPQSTLIFHRIFLFFGLRRGG